MVTARMAVLVVVAVVYTLPLRFFYPVPDVFFLSNSSSSTCIIPPHYNHHHHHHHNHHHQHGGMNEYDTSDSISTVFTSAAVVMVATVIVHLLYSLCHSRSTTRVYSMSSRHDGSLFFHHGRRGKKQQRKTYTAVLLSTIHQPTYTQVDDSSKHAAARVPRGSYTAYILYFFAFFHSVPLQN